MRSSGMRVALFVVDVFVALTAIGGGIALATGLEANRFPVDWLRGTPFSSYMIPGLILTVVVGGSAAVAAVATLRSPDAGALASILAGVVMMGWIVGEILILTQHSWLEAVYFAIGLMMVVLALMVERA